MGYILMKDVFTITVSGVSGSGKSATVLAIANLLGDASCFYFDDYGEQMQQPEDGLKWIESGANLAEFVLPQFGADVRKLSQGETVISPTGRTVEPAKFIVIEEPFGRGRADISGLVDFSVCIETPMEIALARRILDVAEKWEGEPEQRMLWLAGYLKSYLFEGMRDVYSAINERVKESCDLILDGTQKVENNAMRVVERVTGNKRI